MAAMADNGGREIGQDVAPLAITSFRDRQQTSRGQLALGAAVAEADFAPLDAGAERPFSAVVGRFNAFLFQEREQPLIVLEKGGGQIADLAVRAIQVPLGQFDNPFFDWDRSQDQLASIDLAPSKLVPEAE